MDKSLDLKTKLQSLVQPQCEKKTSIGGQALLEGIYMQGPKLFSTALLSADHCIFYDLEPREKKHHWLSKLPLLRGAYVLVRSLKIGSKALAKSSRFQELQVDLDISFLPDLWAYLEIKGLIIKDQELSNHLEISVYKVPSMPAFLEFIDKHQSDLQKKILDQDRSVLEVSSKPQDTHSEKANFGSVFSIILALAIFIAVPKLLSMAFSYILPFLSALPYQNLVSSLFEGLIRLAFLILYMYLIGKIPEIKRVYMFHASEHQSIFTYEKGKFLTQEAVASMTQYHPRCGTSFLFVFVFFSILIYALLPPMYLVLGILLRILFIPVLAGLSYEFLHLSARYSDSILGKVLSAPGLWLQHISTVKPNDSDIQKTALVALITVIPFDTSDVFSAQNL